LEKIVVKSQLPKLQYLAKNNPIHSKSKNGVK